MNSLLKINPIRHPLNATVRVPGSKSLTNRALLIASLADGTTHLTNALFSDDSRYFAKALQTLGFNVQLDEANHSMTVTGLGGKIPAKKAELFIGNAGTAARFLSAFLTLGDGEYILDGEPRMRERPIGDTSTRLPNETSTPTGIENSDTFSNVKPGSNAYDSYTVWARTVVRTWADAAAVTVRSRPAASTPGAYLMGGGR